MKDALVKFLDWDSEFFGIRIATVIPSAISAHELRLIDAWCSENGIDCLYFLAAPESNSSLSLARASGFKQVDTRTTLSVHLSDIKSSAGKSIPNIRPAADVDIPALKTIAAESHYDSRFYADGNFPRERCDALFSTWVEKSCNGFADMVFSASAEGQAAGYITCSIADDCNGEIGLIAVSSMFRKRGIGSDLLNAALAWFVDKNIETVTVTTQGKNTQALDFYEKAGFSISSQNLWLHRWYKK